MVRGTAVCYAQGLAYAHDPHPYPYPHRPLLSNGANTPTLCTWSPLRRDGIVSL